MDNLTILIAAIEKLEGFGTAGTVPSRLHNPGDLMFARQAGAKPHPITGKDGKVRVYAEFASDADGLAALKRQIALDASPSRHETLAQFVAKYAPVRDGNITSTYLAGVMKALGVTDPKTLLGAILSAPAKP